MRRVLRSTDEVMHYWANRVQSHGKCGSAVSFRDGLLFSYREVIGKLYDFEGQTYAVITTRAWSPTTGKHQSKARSAARHHKVLQVVDAQDPARNFMEQTLAEIEQALLKSRRAKSDHMTAIHAEHAIRLTEDFNDYARIRGEPERIEADLDTIKAQLATLAETTNRLRAEREAALMASQAVRREAWRGGAYDHLSPVMLRISKDEIQVGVDSKFNPVYGIAIETSQGASIPLDLASTLWKLIEHRRSKGTDKHYTHPVGSYMLTLITGRGDIRVGCHNIPYSEIELIAKQLNLVEETTA